MKLKLVFDHRFIRAKDGNIYSTKNYNYELFSSRYLKIFDSLEIITRIFDRPDYKPEGEKTNGPHLHVKSVGKWCGFKEFISESYKINKLLKKEINEEDSAVCIIAPGMLGNLSIYSMLKKGKPYGAEIVGDPYDIFGEGSTENVLRPLIQFTSSIAQKILCKKASTISYVTESALQKRYPPSKQALATNYSSIELKKEHFVSEPKKYKYDGKEVRIYCVGTMSILYKGQDTLIDALNIIKERNCNVHLTLIGDGIYKKKLEEQVKRLGLENHVAFKGNLPAGEVIRKELDKADIYILPSRQEGVPRTIIEAMARGLPCIGSTIGGIPELLDNDCMVEPNDPKSLSKKIYSMITNTEKMNMEARKNLEKAEKYLDVVLSKKRHVMYKELKRRTEMWKTERH